jgi:hypothetical protein
MKKAASSLFKKNPIKALKSSLPKEDGICNLTELKIGDEGLKELVQVICDNKTFHTLELFGNSISDVGVDYVIEIVQKCPKIHTLKLEFNNISSFGVEKLCNFLKSNNTIKYIDLYNNKIGDDGIEHLCHLLAVNSTLQYLGLFGCDVHDTGAHMLAEILYFGNNKSLRKVVLTNNPIEDDDILEAIDISLKRNLGDRISDDDYPPLFIERLNKKHARTSLRVLSPVNKDSFTAVSSTINVPLAVTVKELPTPAIVETVNSPDGTDNIVPLEENPVRRMMEKAGFKTYVMPPPKIEAPPPKRVHARAMKDETKIFGVPLDLILRRKGEYGPYPAVLEHILNYLEEKCLDTEGLLRIPGHTGEIDKLKAAIDQGQKIDFDTLDITGKPHTICGLLKAFTRELPEPLLTYEYFDQFIEIAKKTNSSVQFEDLKHLISMLPTPYRVCLGRILQFFSKVIASPDTKMTPTSIGTCFGINFLRMRPDQEDPMKLAQSTKFINKVCELLVVFTDNLFETKIVLNPEPAPEPQATADENPDKKRIAALQFENGALKRKVEQLQQEKKNLEEQLEASTGKSANPSADKLKITNLETEVTSLKREVERLKKLNEELMNKVRILDQVSE